MQYVMLVLIVCFVVISSLILKKGLHNNYSAICLMFALIIALWYIALLTEDNAILTKELASRDQAEIHTIMNMMLDKIESLSIVESPTPTPTLASTPIPQIIQAEPERYAFTDNDIYLMARLLCGSKYKDGDGEYDFDYGNEDEYNQISLVLCVVMNRVRDDRFPNTVEEVVTQRYSGHGYQFSAVALWNSDNGEVSETAIQQVTEWCNYYNQSDVKAQTIPENYVYFSSYGKGVNIARSGL